jgi:hypothetical protein
MVIIVFVFLMLAAAVSLFLSSGVNLAPQDSFADNTDRSFVYKPEMSQFESENAASLAGNSFFATSKKVPYSLGGYKKLVSLRFGLENVPIGSNVEMCVVSKKMEEVDEGSADELIQNIYCEDKYMDESSEVSFEMSNIEAIVDYSNIYYCKFKLVNPSQVSLEDAAFEGARADCELRFEPLEDGGDSTNHLLSFGSDDYAVGPKIYSEKIALDKGFSLVGLGQNFVYADNLGQQRGVEEVCVSNLITGKSYCEVGAKGSIDYLQNPVNFKKEDELMITCKISSGRLGKCSVNLLLQYVD